MGRSDAARAEIEDAAKARGAHDFIAALPNGYATDIQKRGDKLSLEWCRSPNQLASFKAVQRRPLATQF